jgi:7-cyano-7-deazaguanine reductase
MNELSNTPLGKITAYIDTYSPNLLVGIPRTIAREEIGLTTKNIHFHGYDFWNCYELSWLNFSGKPCVALLNFIVPFDSELISESKSVKLYLNSFNNTRMIDKDQVLNTITNDLSNIVKAPIKAEIKEIYDLSGSKILSFSGVCIDNLEIEIDEYKVNPNLLKLESHNEIVEECLYSNLLKSNCLITNQPDWATIQIKYTGHKINHESLLKYIVSFRNHNEFHEQCVERVFCDIMRVCKPIELEVFAKYTRRGGIDISPYRTNKIIEDTEVYKYRDVRQ